MRTMKNHLSIVQCEYFEHRNLTTVNKYTFTEYHILISNSRKKSIIFLCRVIYGSMLKSIYDCRLPLNSFHRKSEQVTKMRYQEKVL